MRTRRTGDRLGKLAQATTQEYNPQDGQNETLHRTVSGHRLRFRREKTTVCEARSIPALSMPRAPTRGRPRPRPVRRASRSEQLQDANGDGCRPTLLNNLTGATRQELFLVADYMAGVADRFALQVLDHLAVRDGVLRRRA